jgi:hypothetical protein
MSRARLKVVALCDSAGLLTPGSGRLLSLQGASMMKFPKFTFLISILGSASIFVLASGAPQAAKPAQTARVPEQQLIAVLDRAFKRKFLDTRRVRKEPDGSYYRWVTTGDAVLKPTIAQPLETLRKACTAAGGTLELAISGGRETNVLSTTILVLGQQRAELSRAEMWSLFAPGSQYASVTAARGFGPVFAASPFAERATSSADVDPPFGLFACKTGTGNYVWAAAVLPLTVPREFNEATGQSETSPYDVAIKVTPVTTSWIRGHNTRLAAEKIADDRITREVERQRKAEIAEEARLRQFRADLQVGSRTNCGTVIAVRNPLVQVQLPPYVSAPNGDREFWVRRDELTDSSPPTGCRYGE